MDMRTGQAFVFDAGSFYGHNEYDTGNWRAPRHKLSNEAYIKEYKKRFPVSEPEKDWDARNLLYSLTFNLGNTIHVPGSSQKQVVYDDMTRLCKMFCDADLKEGLKGVNTANSEHDTIDHETADPEDVVVLEDPEKGEKEEKEEKEEQEVDIKSKETDVEKEEFNDRHGESGDKEKSSGDEKRKE